MDSFTTRLPERVFCAEKWTNFARFAPIHSTALR
jgi:hypothetical protein